MIKGVIFDCFGVLTEDGWLAFLNKYSNKNTLEEMRYANHQADRGLISYSEFLKTICELSGAPEAEAHAMITTSHHPSEPLFAYIRKLKNAGYKLGVISNAGSELTHYLPSEYVNLFDEITLSYKVGVIKPEPAIYQTQLQQLQLPAEQTVFIDDREPNVAGAQAVGMNSFTYTTYEQTIQELTKRGVIVSSDI